MLNIRGFKQHIIALHPEIARDIILPIGALVTVPDVFGVAQVGRIVAYGFSSDYAEELRGVMKYTVQGLDGSVLGRVERSEDQIFIISVDR